MPWKVVSLVNSASSDACKEMATGTTPSAADEELRTTDEKANFQRLTRLLMRGGLALLREVFDAIHPPANLPAVLGNPAVKKQLQTLRRNRVLTYPEWECLYNPSSGAYGMSTDFDISLLCKLLREICNLPSPITGWDTLPSSTNHSLEADLVRIRIYRNEIYGHNHSMEITDADFKKLWEKISEALLRIAGGVSSAKRDEWKKSIESFFHDPLSPDAQENVIQLRLWYRKEIETKDKVEELAEEVKQIKIKQEQMHMDILILVDSFTCKASGTPVPPLPIAARQVQVARLQSKLSEETRTPIPQEKPSIEDTPTGLSSPSASTERQGSQQNRPIVLDFWYVVYSFKKPLDLLLEYLKLKLGVDVQGYRLGSLIVTVSCSSLEVLEALWKDYRTGHLNEVVQVTLVREEVLKQLDLREATLRTIISEEDYLSYKNFLKYRSGKTKKRAPQDPTISNPKPAAGKEKSKALKGEFVSRLATGKTKSKAFSGEFEPWLAAGTAEMNTFRVMDMPHTEVAYPAYAGGKAKRKAIPGEFVSRLAAGRAEMNPDSQTIAMDASLKEVAYPARARGSIIKIAEQPKSQTAKEGSKVELACKIERASKRFMYQWYKDSVAMDGKNETVLVLDPVELRDFGSYVCHVSDKNSDDEGEDSNTAKLDVIPQPGRNGMRPKLLTELDYEMRDDLASLLEIKNPRLRGWRAIGSKYGLTHYKLRLIANSGEPGTNVLEYLATREPELTVYDFCKTLKDSFKRLDIVAKLENHFLVAISDEDGR